DGCSGAVIGGAVVRDLRLPTYAGRYLYGDYCHQHLWTADLNAPSPALLETDPEVGGGVTSIDRDAACRIYITSQAGWVKRVDPAPGTPTGPVGCAPAPPGDPGADPSDPAPATGVAASPPAVTVVDRTPPVVT